MENVMLAANISLPLSMLNRFNVFMKKNQKFMFFDSFSKKFLFIKNITAADKFARFPKFQCNDPKTFPCVQSTSNTFNIIVAVLSSSFANNSRKILFRSNI